MIHGNTGAVRAKRKSDLIKPSRARSETILGMDSWLLGASVLLTLLGAWIIFSVSYVDLLHNNVKTPNLLAAYRPLITQLGWLVVGLCAAFIISRVPLPFIRKWAVALLLFNIALIVLTYIDPFKVTLNSSHRWFRIPGVPMLTFQPSEMLKLTSILFIASYYARDLKQRQRTIGTFLIWVGLWLGACILVLKQPDMGTMMLIMLTGFCAAYLGGLAFWKIGVLLFLSAFIGTALVVSEPYRLQRVISFWQPWKYEKTSGYQIVQAQMAFGKGGITGTGFGEGRSKRYLPAAQSDYVFATVSEELGLIGGAGCLLMLGILVARCLTIASRAKDRYARLVVGSIGLWIGFQSIMNLIMTTGWLPPVGVPLPFVSLGGSSLVVLMIALGIAHGVHRKGAVA